MVRAQGYCVRNRINRLKSFYKAKAFKSKAKLNNYKKKRYLSKPKAQVLSSAKTVPKSSPYEENHKNVMSCLSQQFHAQIRRKIKSLIVSPWKTLVPLSKILYSLAWYHKKFPFLWFLLVHWLRWKPHQSFAPNFPRKFLMEQLRSSHQNDPPFCRMSSYGSYMTYLPFNLTYRCPIS